MSCSCYSGCRANHGTNLGVSANLTNSCIDEKILSESKTVYLEDTWRPRKMALVWHSKPKDGYRKGRRTCSDTIGCLHSWPF